MQNTTESLKRLESLRDRLGLKLDLTSIQPLREHFNAVAASLIALAAEGIGISAEEFRKRFKGIRLVNSTEVNGQTITMDRWQTFEITLNLGLMVFFHQMATVFASSVTFTDDEGLRKETKIPFIKTKEVALNLMNAFWEQQLLKPGEGTFHLDELSYEQGALGGGIVLCMEDFVIAHEFGHVMIHLKPIDADFILNYVSDELEQYSPGPFSEIRNQWSEEFAADLLGLNLLLNAVPQSDMGRILSYGGVELVFILEDMLEEFFEKTFNQSYPAQSHPYARMRFDFLRKIMREENPKHAFQVGDTFSVLAKEILKAL